MGEYSITIKELPEESRPRERLLRQGAGALSNEELLAILLRTGVENESVLSMAQRMLKECGGIHFLAAATVDELKSQRGIGEAKACQIKAAVELGKRIASTSKEVRPQIKCPQDVANLLMEEMRFLDREHFKVISLGTKNRVEAVDDISVGSLNASLVHPREVFKNAVKRNAAGVILIHNHPSGDPTPSREDLQITKRLVEAGEIMGISVYDHLIFGERNFISLKEQGKI